MKYALFSEDSSFIKRWETILGKNNSKIINDTESLLKVEKNIAVFDTSSLGDELKKAIETLIEKGNKVLVLDRLPNMKKAEEVLSLGAKGYGNAIMSKSYLLSAVDAVEKDLIWVAPDVAISFVKHFVNKNPESKKASDELFSDLTSKELEIAELIRDGHTNYEICNKLKISINTIKTHIKHIYRKLDVTDRISFAMLFE